MALDFFYCPLDIVHIRFMTLSNLFVRHFIDLYLPFSLASAFFSFLLYVLSLFSVLNHSHATAFNIHIASRLDSTRFRSAVAVVVFLIE